MARMIPPNISERAPEGERIVYNRLRDLLDDTYIVFHSFDLLTPGWGNKLIESEIDFLVLFPEGDLLVLEVKGGLISYDGTQELWSQNGRPLSRSPFSQARSCRHDVERFLERRLGKAPKCAAGYAVCFPDDSVEPERLPHDAEPQIVIGRGQLPHIDAAVKSAMRAFRPSYKFIPSPAEVKEIREALMPIFEWGVSLADELSLAERQVFSLTEDQCRLLEFIRNQKRVLIKGCAGSGKSVMAVRKARELAADGKRVLLLAWNEMIASQLAAALKELAPAATVAHYHGYCLECLRRAGRLPPSRPADSAYWDTEIPGLFAKLLREQPAKYDAVIVDEGQDFKREYWATIKDLLADDGWFYIFYDPGQNVRGISLSFPISAEPFELRENCRSTKKLCIACQKHSLSPMAPRPGLPEGEDVIIFAEPSPEKRREKLGALLRQLVEERRLPASRIVILGGHSMAHTCIGGDPAVGAFTIADKPSAGGNSAVRYYTYMKYKGCEADAVILLDVDARDARWSREGLYTAMSRSKFLLFILRAP